MVFLSCLWRSFIYRLTDTTGKGPLPVIFLLLEQIDLPAVIVPTPRIGTPL